MRKGFLLLFIALCLLASACVRSAPTLMPEYTIPPEVTPTPTPEVTPTPTPEPTPSPTPLIDVTGVDIDGLEHFQRYLSFKNIQVYEQCEDTFIDAVISNSYPKVLMCAVSVSFTDENGELLAETKLQTRDGEYVLLLQPGETTVFAQIDTDMCLTAVPFTFNYDAALGVLPA